MGLGDELMAAGEAQRLSKAFGNCKVAILDKSKVKVRRHELWANNPHIAKPGEKFTKSIINGPEHRSYIKSFSTDKWTWQRYKPIPADMFFSKSEKEFADSVGDGFVVIEPNLKVKPESVNRDWGWKNFISVVETFPNLKWVQIGPASTRVLPNVRLIKTSSPRMAAAALTKARSFVSHEGGMHHMAAAVGLRGVVIYGGFISQNVTGYDIHKHLSATTGLGCGRRYKCAHCQAVMKSITVDMVASSFTECLKCTTY